MSSPPVLSQNIALSLLAGDNGPVVGIPPSLFNTLYMFKGQLEERGSIQLRRDHKQPSYRLRFRGYDGESFRRRINIPIPTEFVPVVKKLLAQWRAEFHAKVNAKKAAKQGRIAAERARRRQERLESKEERLALRLMIGGTEWRQRRLLKEWDAVNKVGLIHSTIWLALKQYARPNPPRGKGDKMTEAKRLGLFQTVDVQQVVREKIQRRRQELGLDRVYAKTAVTEQMIANS